MTLITLRTNEKGQVLLELPNHYFYVSRACGALIHQELRKEQLNKQLLDRSWTKLEIRNCAAYFPYLSRLRAQDAVRHDTKVGTCQQWLQML